MVDDELFQRRHRAAMRVIERVCAPPECEHCRAVPEAAYAVVRALGWVWNGYSYVTMPSLQEAAERWGEG